MKTLRMQLFVAQLLVLAFAPCSFEAADLASGGDLPSETSESVDEGTNAVQGEDTAQESASEEYDAGAEQANSSLDAEREDSWRH